jgi:hypothetical protein
VELAWETGEIVLSIATGDLANPRVAVVATSATSLTCPRRMPWGFSVSINEVRGPSPMPDGTQHWLEFEIQTGDVIRIEAAQFSVRELGR